MSEMDLGKLKLLEELPAFQRCYMVNNTATKTMGQSLEFYRSIHATFDQIVLYLDLFCPRFIAIKGLILREESIPDDLDRVIKKMVSDGRPLASVEYLYNHLHIHDVCFNDPDYNDVPQKVVVSIAKTLASMWQLQLKSSFPDKKFVVGVGNEDAEVEVFAYVDRGETIS